MTRLSVTVIGDHGSLADHPCLSRLAQQVDLPPMETVQKTIRIERAEAEEAVEQLEALDLLPPPAAAEPEPKKGLFGKMEGWFRGN